MCEIKNRLAESSAEFANVNNKKFYKLKLRLKLMVSYKFDYT